MTTRQQDIVKSGLEQAEKFAGRGGSGIIGQIVAKRYSRSETENALANLKCAVDALERLLVATRLPE